MYFKFPENNTQIKFLTVRTLRVIIFKFSHPLPFRLQNLSPGLKCLLVGFGDACTGNYFDFYFVSNY